MKKPIYKKWWFWVVAVIIFFAIVDSLDDEEAKTDELPKEQTETDVQKDEPVAKEQITWEEKVKEVAGSEGSETEKFDTIISFSREYKPTEEELTEFEDYIIKEYKDGKYIMDISNHEYMLENMFKADVIERFYDDSEEKPMDSFAFDFLQNSKYNYRGVDTMISDSTIANEKQMDEALAEMGK